MAILLLAPGIPELLTGSTPFWLFINPVHLAVLMIAYGFPALLLREYAIAHNLSYGRLMHLGMLQGVLIEGLMVNTFYSDDPAKMGMFASYGRWMGVNWPWAIFLTFFHSIYSVLVPVMLVDSMIGRRSLIGAKAAWYMLPAVASVAVLFNLSEETFKPSTPYHLLSLLFMSLILSSFMLSQNAPPVGDKIRFPARALYLFAPIFIVIAFYALAQWSHPLVCISAGVVLYVSLYNSLVGIDVSGTWRTSRDMLIGMIVTGLLAAILDQQYHILVPVAAFSLLLVFLGKRPGWRAA